MLPLIDVIYSVYYQSLGICNKIINPTEIVIHSTTINKTFHAAN